MCTKTKEVTTKDVGVLAKKHMNTTFTYNGRSFNLIKLGWTFKFGTKRRSLGTCRSRSKIVEISSWVINNSSNGMETWNDTILHEIAHAIDFEIRGTSKHDWKWRSIALAIGCNGERCGRIEHSEDVTSKYTTICDNCGTKKPSHKLSKLLQSGRRACGKCCNEFNGGKFSSDFKLRQIKNY